MDDKQLFNLIKNKYQQENGIEKHYFKLNKRNIILITLSVFLFLTVGNDINLTFSNNYDVSSEFIKRDTNIVKNDKSSEVASSSNENKCTIKGYINSKNQKLYYIKDHKNYDKIKINENKGHRIFCDEFLAIKEGWDFAPLN